MPNEGPARGQLYRAAWAFYLLLSFGGVLWIGLREGYLGRTLFFSEQPGIDLLAGLGAGGLLLLLWAFAERTVPLARELNQELSELIGPVTRQEAFALAALSGFAEEFFFRGAVQGQVGIVWATLLFALLHSGPGKAFKLWTVFALLAGALFGALYLWRGALLAPIVAHFLVNGVNLQRITRRPDVRVQG